MSAGQRPGGLTALAVLNFVFGGIKAIVILGLFALLGAASQTTGVDVGEAVAKIEGGGLVWVSILLGLATTVLLIVSGVGYLGQKRFLGRTMGNAYAICSLADSAIGLMAGGNMLVTLIFAVYPLLTLMLINGTFKEDLVN